MPMTKRIDAKATVDSNGKITGYAATFIREPDWANDVIAKGAFADWLNHVHEDGVTVPMLYNHDQSLDSFIGRVTDIREDDHGLLFTAEFDGTEKAQRARELAMDGRLAKFSFAYMVLDQGPVTLPDGRKANELRKLSVDEVSIVLSPCNPDTSVVEIKSDVAEVKSGRRNSKADEGELRRVLELADSITTTVRALLGDEQDEGEEPEPKPEEPTEANGEEAKAADALARLKDVANALLNQ